VSSKRPRRCTDEKSDEFPPLHGIDPDTIRLKFNVEILPDLRETSKMTVAALFCVKADLDQVAVTIRDFMSTRPSTTLADLLTPLFVANPFSAVRASFLRQSSDERDDGAADGRQTGLRRRSIDSFFPASLI